MQKAASAQLAGTHLGASTAMQHSGRQLPLTFLRAGEMALVLKVRGDAETRHHLESLGFVPGAEVRIASAMGGNLIVEIKGTHVGLGRTAASKVLTQEQPQRA